MRGCMWSHCGYSSPDRPCVRHRWCWYYPGMDMEHLVSERHCILSLQQGRPRWLEIGAPSLFLESRNTNKKSIGFTVIAVCKCTSKRWCHDNYRKTSFAWMENQLWAVKCFGLDPTTIKICIVVSCVVLLFKYWFYLHLLCLIQKPIRYVKYMSSTLLIAGQKILLFVQCWTMFSWP